MWQKLWQHFLVDQDILQQMQNSIAEIKSTYGLKYCLEIGPGQWALTKRLKSVFPTENIRAFEADLTLENKIAKFFPLDQVVRGDVLQQKVERKSPPNLLFEKEEEWLILDSPLLQRGARGDLLINWDITWFTVSQTLIAWNLPYYITSPILRKFFEKWTFATGWFLIQKEVAEKIDVDAKKKSFLRWIMNYQYVVKTIIAVPPESFTPPPKVDSAVVTVVKHDIQRACGLDEILIVLDRMSQYSRKTLNKISKLLAKRNIQLLIPQELKAKRVEELGWNEMEMIVMGNRK